ncbi:MAG: hypothetical protein GX415_06275 [Chloroflexi bacterium]|jgi:hypothetical protein|nr:hypothetical protein [Chloroflexota bacterium]HOE35107.1 hypothetical protein [Anaerolineaceae bacterium]
MLVTMRAEKIFTRSSFARAGTARLSLLPAAVCPMLTILKQESAHANGRCFETPQKNADSPLAAGPNHGVLVAGRQLESLYDTLKPQIISVKSLCRFVKGVISRIPGQGDYSYVA